MSDAPAELLYKVLVIGDPGGGKTCLIRRYTDKVFNASSKITVGVDFALKVVQHEKKTVTLQLWDIAGQERHGSMTRVYYQSSLGAVVVCDITKPETFEGAVLWKQDLDQKVFIGSTGKPVPCLLLLNKADLEAERPCHKSEADLDAFCKEHGFISWHKTSAKSDLNVDSSFKRLVEEVAKATADLSSASAEAEEEGNTKVKLAKGDVGGGAKKDSDGKKCKC